MVGFLAMAAMLSSCATTGGGNVGGKGVACPQCRNVVLQNRVFEGWDYELHGGPEEIVKHECPGCQGALTTLLKEGKFQHKCSVCEKTPYTCNVQHAEVRSEF